MSKLDEFKKFVKTKPKLVSYVKEGNATWQDLYETYDLYGEDESVWNKYVGNKSSFDNIINVIKNIDIDEFQNGINSMQRVLTLLSGMTAKETKTYKPRPVYKHFED